MTAAALPPLDWRAMPLHGRVLIEASAGTGKTWNIGVIYLRLLLERGLRVEQVLVTTFTDAAAQELRERLRRRLVEAERLLEAAARDAASVDPLESWLAMLCPDADSVRLALRRIQLARSDLDRAPVSTIHALCQRIQRDYPLQSGAAFADDQLFDEQQLMRECVEDFWRRRYLTGAVDPREAELLLKDGPEGLLRDLGGLANGTDARIEAGGLAELERQLDALRTDASIAELRRLAGDKSLYAPRKTALSNRLGKIADALQSNDEETLAARLDKTFEPDAVLEQEAPESTEPLNTHPLIKALQALRPLLGLRDVFTRGAVLADAAQTCREEMPRRARQRHVLTFSMLIDAVYQRLCGEAADAVLADRLFDAFPVALIDEFQDTDQRQFAIFERIYRERGTLVMIGDPKQAIYSFRGGDIAAYLHAGAQAGQRFSLGTNHRSSRALVEALNAWYGHTEGGFGQLPIRYQPVAPAGKADGQPYTVDGQPVAQPLVFHPFRGDALDKKGKPLDALGDLEALALDDCANRIAELLNDPRQAIGGRPVTPGDVAVLLSTNNQVVALRQRLVARGVPCVGSGRGNIFAGEVARELELILYAVLHADDDQAVRGALATTLLGATLEQFHAWQAQPAAFERELERFEAWRALVRSRGVLALVGELLAARATALLALPEGERVLTDLRHLGELLAAEEGARQGLDGLYAWLQEMRREGGDGDAEAADERQLRIESDARRVQLLTIHASKGLEFPLVFLPLAWRIRSQGGSYAPKLLRYHDDAGQRCVDLGSAHFVEHCARHFREELEERLRLLYVALTRTVHAVHVYWVDRGPLPDGDAQTWEWAAIDLLLEQARQKLALPAGEASLDAMAAALGGMRLAAPFADTFTRYRPPAEAPAPRAAQAPLPALRPFQWLHSFSGLTRHAAAVLIDDSGSADETGAEEPVVEADEVVEDGRLLALHPLRGPRFGDAVHQVFELAQPGPLWPDQRQLLHRQLGAQAVAAPHLAHEEALERVGRMIDRARQADLGGGLRLLDLAPKQRIAEFEFQFPVRQVPLATLRRICAAHGHADAIPASLDATTLNGMLTGFADLIFAWDGRFHVLDYKTNWLGARLGDYRGEPLDAAMAAHHYPLQALLYTVALHRYLRQRMDGYTAGRQLGESWYLFVRALGLAPGLGVWRRRWPAALVEALDDAFAGAQEAAA
ncbi:MULTISPECIES: UvrD-helicase domain-containing protein [Rhodanobacter]|uniref:UvrD-helicase domain-containing protein n=1 Tax=Rhodanobacter TaxID=75309 RepID=UPI000417B982|nr:MULTISPECIES: UvrD-helicase domain-containing protein [Rhodanobacter]KZC19789.1 DNA helicase UvrD [Rhodanobacter denitrificans]UJJ52299.1 UvrD-helicase domain-containing protein [Rhodanobacter denitrificans]UJM95045.1 UvrD-helicase domain-containing protein [Rhodanobacter denitrificans]UJM98576.1 UvrD-helicase domain-containing protein [Rhodanobacter denitrificans]UJN22010.1 UvrD-helicase domain-containing protein [Rhodanobacter denitrificans]